MNTGEPQASATSLAQGLPELRGWALRLFRLVWIACLAAAVVGSTFGAWASYRDYRLVARPLGELGLRQGWLSSEVLQAGVGTGAQIVAVNGSPLASADDGALARALQLPEGGAVRLRLRLPDGKQKEFVATRSAARLRKTSAAVGISPDLALVVRMAVTGLASILMLAAAILLFRRRGDPVAALLSLSLLGIVAGDAWGYGFFYHHGLAWLGDVFNGIGYPLLPLVLMVFPDGRFRPLWTRWIALLNIVWAIASYLELSFRELNNVILLGLLAAGVARIGVTYRRLPAGPQRLQIKWAMLGFVVGTAFLLAYVLLDGLRHHPPSEAVFAWASVTAPMAISLYLLAFSAGLLVSILRYRLYDAEAAISRSASYAVLTLMLGGSFAACAKGVEMFFETSFGAQAGAVPGLIGAAIAVMIVTPLSNRVQLWAERRFQKRLLRLRRDLPEALSDLKAGAAGLPELLETIARHVGEGVNASRAAILVGGEPVASRGVDAAEVEGWRAGASLDDGEAVQCQPDDPLFPLRIPLRAQEGAEPAGWLLLGRRPDGSLPGQDERAALREIAAPVSRAIGVVRSRSDHEARHEARLAALESRLAALR